MNESGTDVILFGCKDSAGNVKQMSDRVVVAPRILYDFFHPLRAIHATPPFFKMLWRKGDWSWINKGELLASLDINVKARSWFSTKFVKVPIRSPVSGLIINPTVAFDYTNVCKDGFFNGQLQYGDIAKILLPVSESVPNNASEMYGEFCDFCFENKNLFLREEFPEFDAKSFPNIVQKQRNAPLRLLSFTKDFEKEYLEEVLGKVSAK